MVSSHAGVDDQLTPNCAGRCPDCDCWPSGASTRDRAAIHRRPVPARPAHPAQYPRPQRNHVRDGRRQWRLAQRRPARAPGPRSRPTGSVRDVQRRHAGNLETTSGDVRWIGAGPKPVGSAASSSSASSPTSRGAGVANDNGTLRRDRAGVAGPPQDSRGSSQADSCPLAAHARRPTDQVRPT